MSKIIFQVCKNPHLTKKDCSLKLLADIWESGIERHECTVIVPKTQDCREVHLQICPWSAHEKIEQGVIYILTQFKCVEMSNLPCVAGVSAVKNSRISFSDNEENIDIVIQPRAFVLFFFSIFRLHLHCHFSREDTKISQMFPSTSSNEIASFILKVLPAQTCTYSVA